MLNFRQYTDMTECYIGNNVTLSTNDFSNAFNNMLNLTNSTVPVEKIVNMSCAYINCYNLTGNPVCGANVTDMRRTYYGCTNLTGNPVCGDNVTSLYYAYSGCSNLTGSPVCGNKVTNMGYTYYNCYNICGTSFFYSSNVTNIKNCFYGRNTANRLNIYTPVGSTTLTTCLTADANSMFGQAVTWTEDAENACWYNTAFNVYVYNGTPSLEKVLVDFDYTLHDNGMATLTGWKGTCQGVASTEIIIPDDGRIIL